MSGGAGRQQRLAGAAILTLAVVGWPLPSAVAQAPAPPRILLDVSPRAVEYQLRRLTTDELAVLERRPDDRRYRPVYYALLTRGGLPKPYRDEALDVLTRMDNASRPRVLLDALAILPPEDDLAAGRLIEMLVTEPVDALGQDRTAFAALVTGADRAPAVRRGAYAVLLRLDADPRPHWSAASADEPRLRELLRAVPFVAGGASAAVRSDGAQEIASLLDRPVEPETRAAALDALGSLARDPGTVDILLGEVQRATDERVLGAAVRALDRIPLDQWTDDQKRTVPAAIVAYVGGRPPQQRTSPAIADALQLGQRLAAALPDDVAAPVRRDLRALGVRVVRLATIPEQMRFDLRWFVVEAGTRVQIVLVNPDAMPHNVVVGRPGSLQAIGTAAATMPMPSDPAAKPYVPDTPDVIAATKLVWEGETDRVMVSVPKVTGEYIFACTYPGHWARMYGVMLVVESLEQWEANRVYPKDPLNGEVLR